MYNASVSISAFSFHVSIPLSFVLTSKQREKSSYFDSMSIRWYYWCHFPLLAVQFFLQRTISTPTPQLSTLYTQSSGCGTHFTGLALIDYCVVIVSFHLFREFQFITN